MKTKNTENTAPLIDASTLAAAAGIAVAQALAERGHHRDPAAAGGLAAAGRVLVELGSRYGDADTIRDGLQLQVEAGLRLNQ